MNIKTITIHLLLSYLLFSTIFLSCSTKHKVLYEEPKNPKEKPEDLSVNENGEKLYDVFQGGIFVRETLDSPAKLIGDDEFYRKAFRILDTQQKQGKMELKVRFSSVTKLMN